MNYGFIHFVGPSVRTVNIHQDQMEGGQVEEPRIHRDDAGMVLTKGLALFNFTVRLSQQPAENHVE